VRTDIPAETLADLLASAYATMALSWVHIPDFPVRTRARDLADLLAETLAPRAAVARSSTGPSLPGIASPATIWRSK